MARRLFPLFVRGLHISGGKVETSPGGTLKVLIERSCTLNISPLNPHETDWDHVRVGLQVPESDGIEDNKQSHDDAVKDFGIILISEVLNGKPCVSLTDQAAMGTPNPTHLVVDVHLPGLVDLDVAMKCGTVNVLGTIEGDVAIQSSTAAVNIEKLKSMKVSVSSDAGGVSADVLQGDVCIYSGKGDISVGKVQGPRVNLQTTSGGIRTRAIYSEEIVLSSRGGSIQLDGIKGNTTVSTTEGNVTVSAVQGNLFVESDSGNIVAELSQPELVSLETNSGNVSVGIPKELQAAFDLKGQKSIDDAIVLTEVTECATTNSFKGQYVPDVTSSATNCSSTNTQSSRIKARAPLGQLRLYLARWGPSWLQ